MREPLLVFLSADTVEEKAIVIPKIGTKVGAGWMQTPGINCPQTTSKRIPADGVHFAPTDPKKNLA
jgi:hypothetical protein